jgi:DNA-binding response OmpR family regulator
VRLIEQAKYTVKGAASGAEAIKLAEEMPTAPDLFLVDSQLPDIKGVDLIATFREKYPASKIVMATMLDDRPLIEQAFKNGCDVFLVKPHGFMELFKRLQKLGTEPELLSQLIIDNLGVRPFKG